MDEWATGATGRIMAVPKTKTQNQRIDETWICYYFHLHFSPLKSRLRNIGVTQGHSCPLCPLLDESAEHLFECPALNELMVQHIPNTHSYQEQTHYNNFLMSLWGFLSTRNSLEFGESCKSKYLSLAEGQKTHDLWLLRVSKPLLFLYIYQLWIGVHRPERWQAQKEHGKTCWSTYGWLVFPLFPLRPQLPSTNCDCQPSEDAYNLDTVS